MPVPDNLKRNQAILWARDVLGREEECLIVCCDMEDTAAIKRDGKVCLLGLSGTVKGVDLPFASLSDAATAQVLQQTLAGKEVIAVGLDAPFQDFLVGIGASRCTDLMVRYKEFLGMDVNISANCSAANLATWTFDALRTMASSSLVLDQADTGEQKWTASHFKVSPGVLDRLRAFIK